VSQRGHGTQHGTQPDDHWIRICGILLDCIKTQITLIHAVILRHSFITIMFGYQNLQDERVFHQSVAYGMIYSAVLTFVITSSVVESPFGKHAPSSSRTWLGPLLPARPCWFLFESPNLLWVYHCYRHCNHVMFGACHAICLGLFTIHYVQRCMLYPLLLSKHSKPMPLLVVVTAFAFCFVNG
jgi:hypothetical protein